MQVGWVSPILDCTVSRASESEMHTAADHQQENSRSQFLQLGGRWVQTPRCTLSNVHIFSSHNRPSLETDLVLCNVSTTTGYGPLGHEGNDAVNDAASKRKLMIRFGHCIHTSDYHC